jgi:hypothetical protein
MATSTALPFSRKAAQHIRFGIPVIPLVPNDSASSPLTLPSLRAGMPKTRITTSVSSPWRRNMVSVFLNSTGRRD